MVIFIALFNLFKYSFIIRTGVFVYKGEMSEDNEEELFSLHDIDYPGKFHVIRKPPNITSKITLDEMFKDAERILTDDTAEISKVRIVNTCIVENILVLACSAPHTLFMS